MAISKILFHFSYVSYIISGNQNFHLTACKYIFDRKTFMQKSISWHKSYTSRKSQKISSVLDPNRDATSDQQCATSNFVRYDAENLAHI